MGLGPVTRGSWVVSMKTKVQIDKQLLFNFVLKEMSQAYIKTAMQL